MMKHYEIILMIHPEYTEQIVDTIKNYKSIIKKDGLIHRLEDWGRLQLAYPIQKLYKAHYILLNIEVTKKIINTLNNNLNIDKKIIRSMIIKVNKKFTEQSIMIKKTEKEKTEKSYK